jgi:ribosome biogenesis GTPase A
MPSFWDAVNKVIKESDVIIEVIDARFPKETRNKELEDKAKKEGKEIILVYNKADLVKKKDQKGIYVSSTKEKGLGELRREIKKHLPDKERNVIGIVGYPNVGKSSVLNALSQREAARTSPESGFTKGMQLVKIQDGLYILDTPGVIPYMEKDKSKHVLTATIDFSKVKDPEGTAEELIEKFENAIKKHYKVKGEDPEEILEAIAKRLNKLKKGGILDITNTARTVLMDWQRGKIKAL